MGLRLDLRTANWVAYLIEEEAPLPSLLDFGLREDRWTIEEIFRLLSEKILINYITEDSSAYSSFKNELFDLRNQIRSLNDLSDLRVLKKYFNPRDWTAFIIPDDKSDFLTSPDLLNTLVGIGSTDRGLLLQLEASPRDVFSLTNIFPALSIAIERRTDWPALVVWNKDHEVEIFPLSAADRHTSLSQLMWILRQLYLGSLKKVKEHYDNNFNIKPKRLVNIIQISDIHLGSNEASLRLPRLQQHILNLVEHYNKVSDTLVVVTGDLMDDPSTRNLDQVRVFVNFLNSLPTEPPILLLGNHDVRNSGIFNESLRSALQLPLNRTLSGVQWFDSLGIGIITFNSVTEGYLATGAVGERQFDDLAIHLDQKKNRDDFVIIGAVHHHPMPVKRPDWYVAPFYERILGSRIFEKTDCLHDSDSFLTFVKDQGLAAVIHGHKHIPQLGLIPKTNIPVIGCGSSVGKITTKDGTPYLSININTIDLTNKKIMARLLASRAQGGRLNQVGEHEVNFVTNLSFFKSI